VRWAPNVRTSALVRPTPSESRSIYTVNLTFALNNLVRRYAPNLDPVVYGVPMDPEEDGSRGVWRPLRPSRTPSETRRVVRPLYALLPRGGRPLGPGRLGP
jgi:hypothetical protein